MPCLNTLFVDHSPLNQSIHNIFTLSLTLCVHQQNSYSFADLSAELTGHGGLSIEELQNDTTSISTVTGTTTIRKLQCPLMRYNTHEGVLAIPGKLLASVEAHGRTLVSRDDGEISFGGALTILATRLLFDCLHYLIMTVPYLNFAGASCMICS